MVVYVRKESVQICEQEYFKSELPDSGFEDHPINKVHSSIKTNSPFIPPAQLKHIWIPLNCKTKINE